MNRQIVSVFVFAAGGLAIGYAMQQGYKHFFAVEQPWKLLGYLCIFVTTGLAGLGLNSLASIAVTPSRPHALPESTATSQ